MRVRPAQEPDTPALDLGSGGSFQARGAWDDLSQALEGAQKLIYIIGWSVYTDITLVRSPDKPMRPSEAPSLGAGAPPAETGSAPELHQICQGWPRITVCKPSNSLARPTRWSIGDREILARRTRLSC